MSTSTCAPGLRPIEHELPSQLVVTDQPDSWLVLVEQIAELEELLAELDHEHDRHAHDLALRIGKLLEAKRRSLHAIDVG